MIAYQFARIFLRRPVGFLILSPMQQQVVSYTTSNKTLFDIWQSIHGTIHLKQLGVIGIEIRAYRGMDATRTLTFLACLMVASMHTVHICRRTAKVAEIAFESRHFCHLFHLAQYAFLGAAGDKLALVGGDSAESTSSEASTMDIYRELYHLVCRNRLALVFGMRQTGVRQVKRGIKFLGSHRRIRRIDHNSVSAYILQQSVGVHHVRLLLDMPEVVSLFLLVLQTFLMAVQKDVVVGDTSGHGVSGSEINSLWNIAYGPDGQSLVQLSAQFHHWFFAHPIDNQVGTAVTQYAWPHLVLPVVIVGESAQ